MHLPTMERRRFLFQLGIVAIVAALVHFYAAWWFDVTRQHDPSKHYAVLDGLANLEAFRSYNAPYYYLLVAFVSAPMIALYRMHLIGDAAFMSLSVAWSGFVLLTAYILGSFALARVLRFRSTEQFFFVALCVFLPPVQRSFSMLRPENLILTLTPFACALLISWWRAMRNGVPAMRFPALYPVLGIMGLIASQKITGTLLVGALWFFLFLFTPGSLAARVRQLRHPALILIAIILALVFIDRSTTGVSIFEHPASSRADYQRKPKLSVFTTFDPVKAWETPLRNSQAGSMANILLVDLFGDYRGYGILQDKGQTAKWNVFRSRVGIVGAAIFAVVYLLSLGVMFLPLVRSTRGNPILRERAVLAALFFLGFVILIAASTTQYNPNKFDIIKWEYIIMFVPFMMIPPIHLLSKCNMVLKRALLFPALSILLCFAVLQSTWIDPAIISIL